MLSSTSFSCRGDESGEDVMVILSLLERIEAVSDGIELDTKVTSSSPTCSLDGAGDEEMDGQYEI